MDGGKGDREKNRQLEGVPTGMQWVDAEWVAQKGGEYVVGNVGE